MCALGVNNLDANLTSPAKNYLFEVRFANPISGDSETLTIRCQTASIPERSVGTLKVEYKQTAGIKYPGKVRFPQTWSLTFIEGEDRAILDAMYAWLQSITDAKTGLGSVVVKTDLYLTLINTDGTEIKNIRLIGCYPESVGEVSLSYDSDTDIRYPVTFSYDRWELS